MNFLKFVDEKVRLILNDPATGEWQIYLWDWKLPFKGNSFTETVLKAIDGAQ